IPEFAVELMRDSKDPRAGQFVWDSLKPLIERERALKRMTDHQKRLASLADLENPRPRFYSGTPFRTLNSLGREEALLCCRKGLLSDVETIRSWSLEGIKRWADAESVPTVLKLLETTKSHDEKGWLIEALGILEDRRAVPALLDWLEKDAGRYDPHRHFWQM